MVHLGRHLEEWHKRGGVYVGFTNDDVLHGCVRGLTFDG